MLVKAEAGIDKSCGTLDPFFIESIYACPGASTADDLKTCVACESWDSTLDIVAEAVAHHDGVARRHVELRERRQKDAGVRLHVAVIGRRHRSRDEVPQLEV